MEKQFDIIIFGATGFTGQFVVDEVSKVAIEEGNLTWAIAGRSMKKLVKVLQEASKRTGNTLGEMPIVIADGDNYDSLVEMCRQARVVLNCVGPYRFYGRKVVMACLEGGASHVDISGEPIFLENMELMFNMKAREKGVYIVGACGFDSIPADIGVMFMRNKFKGALPLKDTGDLNSVEGFVEFHPGPEGSSINVGTLESAIYGFADRNQLIPIRKLLFSKPLPRSPHPVPKRQMLFFCKELGKWCVPFLGSDKSVVQRTQKYQLQEHQQRPIQFVPYLCQRSLFSAFCLALFGIMFTIMTKFNFTRSLLLKFPSFFTAGTFKVGGPTYSQIESTSFSLTFYGNGYSEKLNDTEAQHDTPPDLKIVTRVVGPEPGYVTTPICMVQAAVVIIREKESLPKEGGVYTPASIFARTTLVERLRKRNIKFEVVEE